MRTGVNRNVTFFFFAIRRVKFYTRTEIVCGVTDTDGDPSDNFPRPIAVVFSSTAPAVRRLRLPPLRESHVRWDHIAKRYRITRPED